MTIHTTPPDWLTSTIATVPITAGTAGQRFTTGSRLSAGHDDDAMEAGLRVNTLFLARPELVLGQIGMVRQNGLLWQAVTPPTMASVCELLAARLASELPTDVFRPVDPARLSVAPPRRITTPEPTPRMRAWLAVYETAKLLLRTEAAGLAADDLRADLNRCYDACVAMYGCVHSRTNQQALKGMPELYFLRALETNAREEQGLLRAEKAAIFTQSIVHPTPKVAIGHMTPDEALLRCLNDTGRIDLPTITIYCGQSEAAVITALSGRIFFDPDGQQWVTADAYLAGNVRAKLIVAESAAAADPSLHGNVSALAAVQPIPLTAGQIDARLGAPWIPADVIAEFIGSIIPRFNGTGSWSGTVIYYAPLAQWSIKDRCRAAYSTEATATWGTARKNAIDLMEDALNGRVPVVYDTTEIDGAERRIPNKKETLLAQEKWRALTERFSSWVWEDAARADRLCAIYNDTFNTHRRRDFDGSHLLLPGINRSILRGGDLLPHQKDAIWCALQQQTTLLDLPVGAGKTFIGIAWAFEARRLGICKKPMIVVPNHLVEQWGADMNRLYPELRVLVMSPEDFSKERRGEFLARIATEEFDAVVCAHTSFGFIEPGQIERDFIIREVDRLRTYLLDLRSSGDEKEHKRSIKKIEEKVRAFETRLKEKSHEIKRDDARIITWAELGIDGLFVDEFHDFKNLSVPTIMGTIPGVPKGDSKRAFDMRIKIWDLIRRGGKVVAATGTPILNSVGEAFIMKLYLAEALLESVGLEMFDAWARTFAQIVPIFEMTPDGGGFRINIRLAQFVNLPELFSIWYQFTFARSREQLGLPTPALMSGKRIGIRIPASPHLRAYVQACVARVEAIKSGEVDPRIDNMLKVVSDAKKAALDTRLVLGSTLPEVAITPSVDADPND
ncbi:MAG: hypothetical protein Fur005_43000 [Roseiflexaceae bacterium]